LLEFKILVVKMLLKFEFAPCVKTQIPIELHKIGFLKPKIPIMLKIKPRESRFTLF
jgi:hypothetical protein